MELLIGQDFAGYLPRVEQVRGHMLLLRSLFGTGRLLSGRTGMGEDLGCQHALSVQAVEMRNGIRQLPKSAQVNFLTAQPPLPNFFEAEELACHPPPSCPTHRKEQENCRECRFRGETMTHLERASLERMEDSLIKREDGKLSISYPFNPLAYKQRRSVASKATWRGQWSARASSRSSTAR